MSLLKTAIIIIFVMPTVKNWKGHKRQIISFQEIRKNALIACAKFPWIYFVQKANTLIAFTLFGRADNVPEIVKELPIHKIGAYAVFTFHRRCARVEM